jgi:hypothetical protein
MPRFAKRLEPARDVLLAAGDGGVAADCGEPCRSHVGGTRLPGLGDFQAGGEISGDVERGRIEDAELDARTAPAQAAVREPGHRVPEDRQRGVDVSVVVVEAGERVPHAQLGREISEGNRSFQSVPKPGRCPVTIPVDLVEESESCE